MKEKERREEPLFYQSVVEGIADEFGCGGQVEFFKQAGAIGTNRIHTEANLFGYLRNRFSTGQQTQHLKLAIG